MTQGLRRLAQALTGQGIACEFGAPLAPLTTFQIGGPAGLLVWPKTTDQAAACMRHTFELSVPCLVLGWGSNVLIADEGYPHLVVCTRDLNWIAGEGATLNCGAGAGVPDVAREAAQRGLSGMEKISDVPGSLGGGVYMNAGCEGVTLSDLLTRVTWVEPDGSVILRPRDQVRLGYRTSEFMGTSRLITEVVLELTPAHDPEAILQAMDAVRCQRAAKFPLDLPNCGSVFKRVNPEVAKPWVERDGKAAYSAGYYVERVGLKGSRVGNAQISPRHANFIVNLGGATAADVLELAEQARAKVREVFGFDLELEVNVIDRRGRRE